VPGYRPENWVLLGPEILQESGLITSKLGFSIKFPSFEVMSPDFWSFLGSNRTGFSGLYPGKIIPHPTGN
jgi:hypothetical protein